MVRTLRRALIGLSLLIGAFVLFLLAYVLWIVSGVRSGVAATDGTRSGFALQAPVRIVRDQRGIPHIRAQNEHDLFFAQGYVTGSDRLFQIDLTRRFVYGRLSELLGPPTLHVDLDHRILDVTRVVGAEYARLGAREKAALAAFADGINAAAANEPQPPEYRVLVAAFERWKPEDGLAVGFATVLDLADSWNEVITRDAVLRAAGPDGAAAYFSLTDPAYDTPTVGGAPLPVATLPPARIARPGAHVAWEGEARRDVLGSNEWVAGASHTATGRALLANDPHLSRGIPGIWYLTDLQAPGLHVAGATLAGVPGVILGHNEHVAWGSTNGTVAAPRVFTERFTSDGGIEYATSRGTVRAAERTEIFHVRFGKDYVQRYLATKHGFVVEARGTYRHAVQWGIAESSVSPVQAFLALDRAGSIEDGMRALAGYPGPTQNFVLADTSGRAAYTLAGEIPDDAAWGLHTLDGAALSAGGMRSVPFARLPHLAASRSTLAVNSNNLQYGAGYPFRLSPNFTPPYRAAEITRRLAAVPHLSAADFQAIQADTNSLAEAEFARLCVRALRATHADRDPAIVPAFAALAAFDGRFEPGSRGATVVQHVRTVATADLIAQHLPDDVARAYLETGPAFTTMLRALRERPPGWFARNDPDAFLTAEVRAAVRRFGTALDTPYGDAFAVAARHPLAAFGVRGWDGSLVAGRGGSYAPAVQGVRLGQSFRAVWDVGAWDAGGIDIPLGESGEPGSQHYRDLAERYARHELTPLPFSATALASAARETLILRP
ncbi:MAG: penicillin acylase family protein [Candidatus Velthaea sp.]